MQQCLTVERKGEEENTSGLQTLSESCLLMSVYATWFIDWSFVSSSFCEATAIIVLIILSLYRGSAVRKKKKREKREKITK